MVVECDRCGAAMSSAAFFSRSLWPSGRRVMLRTTSDQ